MKRHHLYLLGALLTGTIVGPMAVVTVRAVLVVNTNVQSLEALRKLNETQQALSATFERISAGLRINKAADDAAGLGVAENLDAESRSLRQGMRNTNDGISVIQTAESASNEVANIIKRMRELAVQSSSETLAADERAYVQDEFEQLSAEVERITQQTITLSSISDDGLSPSTQVTVAVDLLQDRLREIGTILNASLELMKEPTPQHEKRIFFIKQSPATKQIAAAEKLMEKTQKDILRSMKELQKEAQKENDRIAAGAASISSASSSTGKKKAASQRSKSRSL